MKLATLEVGGWPRVVGSLGDGRLADLAAVGAHVGLGPTGFPSSMLQLIEAGRLGWDFVKRVEEIARGVEPDAPEARFVYNESAVRWKAPILRPGKMPFVFGNMITGPGSPTTIGRIDEGSGGRWPRPQYFLKAETSIIGHKEEIVLYEDMGIVQPEAELCFVIGRRAKDVRAEDAMEYIAGYSLFDDVTGAGLSWQEGIRVVTSAGLRTGEEYYSRPMARFKGVDTFGPFGPYLVPREEIPNIEDVIVTGRFNGGVFQRGRIGEYKFGIPEVIETISATMTLEPGDVVSMGTVTPVSGNLRSTDLREGGLVEVEAAEIGLLSNPIKVLPAHWPDCPPGRDSRPIKRI